MSALSVSIIFFVVGLLVLITRLFFFVDIKAVDKADINRIKINSFSLIIISILLICEGIFIFIMDYKDYINPVDTLIEDFYKGKIFFGAIILFLGAVFIYYKEKMFEDWKKNGYRVPANYAKYKPHIIIIGASLVVSGLILIII